jgi:hypothetical protein
MKKNPADEFFKSIDYPSIIDTIKGIFTSDGSISTLIDFERVLDEADLYAFKNWDLGELVNGPEIKKYTVACTFMWPYNLMPNPKGGKRLSGIGCSVLVKKTKIEVPIEVKNPMDFKPGTHYPRMIEREVWLIRIEMPKELMNEIREGSIDLADQTIELDELDNAYEKDYDKESEQGGEQTDNMASGPMPGPMPGGAPPMPGAPPAPGMPM